MPGLPSFWGHWGRVWPQPAPVSAGQPYSLEGIAVPWLGTTSLPTFMASTTKSLSAPSPLAFSFVGAKYPSASLFKGYM